jgi:hypothetical protein
VQSYQTRHYLTKILKVNIMARIIERLANDGTKRYAVTVRLRGYPTQSATFKRKTDAQKWIQDTESAIREGRHFKTIEAKKHTFADMINRYIKDVFPTKPKSEKRRNYSAPSQK